MKTKFCLCLIFLITFNLFAGVNLKNGNFYISYTDLLTKHVQFVFGDFSRTYNSKSIKTGLFGYGWGTKWETELYFFPDGYISVHEYGAGDKSAFNSDLVSTESIQMMVDIIIDTKLEHGLLDNNPSAILKLQNKLTDMMDVRHAEWLKLKEDNKLDFEQELIDGLVFDGFSRGNQKITITNNGFERISISDQTKEFFDINGRLIKYTDNNGLYTEIKYVDDKITQMICSDGNVIHFKTNDNGYIIEARLDDSVSTYKYDGDNLIYNKDGGGNQYAYEYDNIHNLTRIIYNPARFKGEAIDAMTITYEDRTYCCSSITDRDGKTINYEYKKYFNEDGTEDPDHYSTTVIKDDYYGNKAKSEYEYFIKVGASGNRYTHQVITTIQGIKTNTTYDEQCGNPIKIIKGSRETDFKYNNRCRLIRKTSNYGDDIEMKYHPTLEKLTYVRNDQGEFNFEYNTKGNLLKASKSNGDTVEMEYLDNGKISKMISNDETLLFKYNTMGKPIAIEIEGEGKIDVTYDKYGEIERVDSEDGHSMALKVTQAFQNLLAIVKPSGVNLGM